MARADRAFAALLLLALVASVILIALLGSLIPSALAVLDRGPADIADVVPLLLVLLATLGIGLGLFTLVRQVLATLALIRSLLSCRVEPSERIVMAAHGLDLRGRIDFIDDARPFSFCYWFLRPRICISSGLAGRLEDDELRAVLLHERYHLRHRDPLRLVIARYFAAGLYVVPVVEELVEYYALEKEIEADEDAVRSGGVASLASALYKVLPDADEVSLGLLVPVGSLSVTEARIDRLADGRHAPLALRPLSVTLSAGALVAAVLLLHQPEQALSAIVTSPVLSLSAVLAPASLLIAAAVSGAIQQMRLFARPFAG